MMENNWNKKMKDTSSFNQAMPQQEQTETTSSPNTNTQFKNNSVSYYNPEYINKKNHIRDVGYGFNGLDKPEYIGHRSDKNSNTYNYTSSNKIKNHNDIKSYSRGAHFSYKYSPYTIYLEKLNMDKYFKDNPLSEKELLRKYPNLAEAGIFDKNDWDKWGKDRDVLNDIAKNYVSKIFKNNNKFMPYEFIDYIFAPSSDDEFWDSFKQGLEVLKHSDSNYSSDEIFSKAFVEAWSSSKYNKLDLSPREKKQLEEAVDFIHSFLKPYFSKKKYKEWNNESIRPSYVMSDDEEDY